MNKQIDDTYDLVATTFDRIGPGFFTHSGRRMVELAEVPEGAVVLDVATGRGAVLFPVSEQVGLSGRVIGVDRSVGMVREVTGDIRRVGLRQAKICRMDGEQLGFADEAFDYVLCGHAIYYFPQAAREFHRLLKPGGKVGVSVAIKGSLDWIFDIFRHHLAQVDKDEDEERGEDVSIAINTPAGLEATLRNAGFKCIRVMLEDTEFVYADEEMWWSVLRTMGVRWMLAQMKPEEIKNLKAEMFDYVQAFKQPDGIHIQYKVLYALARTRFCE